MSLAVKTFLNRSLLHLHLQFYYISVTVTCYAVRCT